MQTPSAVVSGCFLADHHRLEELLGQFLATFEANDRAARNRLWTECDSGLVAHLEAEETHLIPALLRWSQRDARVLVLEHRHIRTRLVELGAAFEPDIVRLDTVRDFIDELRAHAQSENRLLYQWADAHLDEPLRITAIDALSASLRAIAKKPMA